MKTTHILLLLLPLFLQSCLMEPPRPSIKLSVDKNSIALIDSLTISVGDNSNKENIECYTKEDLSYEKIVFLPFCEPKFRIKAYLSDTTILVSDVLIHKSNYDDYKIEIKNKSLIISKSYTALILHNIWIFLYILLISFAFKVLLGSYLVKSDKLEKYTYKYTIVNSIYIAALCALNYYIFEFSYFTIILLGFTFNLGIDLVLHHSDKNVIKSNLTINLIAVNLLFYTIGVLIAMVLYNLLP